MTPREKGIERLKREAKNDSLGVAGGSIVLTICAFAIAGGFLGLIYLAIGDSIEGALLYIVLLLAGAILMGLVVWLLRWLARENKGIKRRRHQEIERLTQAKPFYEAYRNGRTLSEALPQKNDERQKLRETYHQLKEAIEAQLKKYKEEKEILQRDGKIEDAQGMAALILDLEDAEKQLHKELAIIERTFHPVQTPHVAAEPSPVGKIDPASETGLEEY